MGNTSASQDRSICGLNFFSSKDTTQTILQLKPTRKPKLRSQTSIPKTQETAQSSTDHVLTKKGKSSEDVIERSTRQKSHTYFPSLKDTKDPKEKSNLSENDFRILQKLAKGRYGKICIVRKGDSDEVLAMKVLCKKKIAFQRRNEVAMMEKDILSKANHPFIPKLVYFFENERNFFLVVEYIEGGELHKILKQLTRFSEEITKFYSAEVLLVLEYLHEQLGFRYNDLKPENVLLDVEGHIKLIDFDFSERIVDHKDKDIFNSKGKMDSPATKLNREAKESSPEIMIDYWKFGCFIYELLSGKPLFPHLKSGSKVIEEHIIEEDMEWPQSISKNAKDLITRLLNPKIEERLGYNGIQEIKKHPFFSHINWEKMLQKSVYPPLNPSQFKENMKEEEEEQESDIEDPNKCSLGHIPDHDDTKGESIGISEDASITPIHNRTPMHSSHRDVSDNSMARST